ncbi:hypothetical protein [Streptomyces sp. PT12]|uniref:hypothetical protein n=1 Tax=Streptomyces sp. PT12 TaxID=1510197 RepID=UPI000DE33ACE|nr:hypothetical protein [Streptomyces sp. PT12]RBM18069.1 hypothetical protein DEH69_13600 [Streptomyces sp. PT12]
MAGAARTEHRDTRDTLQLIPLPTQSSSTSAREAPLTSEPPLDDLAPLTAEQPLAVEPPLTAEPNGRGGAEAVEV